MPKYLLQGSYVGEGLKGLLKEGGSKRRETIAQLVEGMGGSLEAFYYAFGDDVEYVRIEFEDQFGGGDGTVRSSGADVGGKPFAGRHLVPEDFVQCVSGHMVMPQVIAEFFELVEDDYVVAGLPQFPTFVINFLNVGLAPGRGDDLTGNIAKPLKTFPAHFFR